MIPRGRTRVNFRFSLLIGTGAIYREACAAAKNLATAGACAARTATHVRICSIAWAYRRRPPGSWLIRRSKNFSTSARRV